MKSIIERLFTEDDLRAAIELYREFVEVHGHEPEYAILNAIDEICQGYDASVELYDAGQLRHLPAGEKALRALYRDKS